MAQVEQSDKGKKKKGAQKKKQIHVDFTPMVDMNMLLITFFMLCTTMIKPQTLNIALPSNEKNQDQTQGTKAKESDAITLILDTERDANGHVVTLTDPETGKTYPNHIIYYYSGMPLDSLNVEDIIGVAGTDTIITDRAFVDKKVAVQRFRGNTAPGVYNGIRSILHERNSDVLDQIDELKARYKAGELAPGKNKDEQKHAFDSIAAQIRGAKKDTVNNLYDYSELKRPVIIIKPGPNASFENVITALDEMQINQIGQYQINTINGIDSLLINSYKFYHKNDQN